jgi:hypothetical protein
MRLFPMLLALAFMSVCACKRDKNDDLTGICLTGVASSPQQVVLTDKDGKNLLFGSGAKINPDSIKVNSMYESYIGKPQMNEAQGYILVNVMCASRNTTTLWVKSNGQEKVFHITFDMNKATNYTTVSKISVDNGGSGNAKATPYPTIKLPY